MENSGGSFVAGVSREQNPDAQWKPPLPIVSVTGKEVKVPLKYNSNSYLVVKKGTTHPEAIMKMINLYLEKNWGEKPQSTNCFIALLIQSGSCRQ